LNNMEDGMSLTFISNTKESKKLHPDNTDAEWKTTYPEPIRLDENDVNGAAFEMAMTEIQIVTSFPNVGEVGYHIDEFNFRLNEYGEVEKTDFDSETLSKGNYEDVRHLLHHLNTLNVVKKNLKFSYDSNTSRVKVEWDEVNHPDRKHVDLSPRLRAMLGFVPEGGRWIGRGLAPRPVNMYANVRTQLFVYCNLVEPQMVGDRELRVLQVVGLDDVTKYGRLVTKTYDNPHYVPILTPHFDTVEIAIRTYDNRPAPFEFGPSLVKVHVRRRQQRR